MDNLGNSYLVIVLAIATLVLVLGFGFWQLKKVRQSQLNRGEAPGGIAGPGEEKR